ncbi:MAG: hypothetical protein C4340_04840 [Armatimonadota bacterium]
MLGPLQQAVNEILTFGGSPCLSLYLNTHRASVQAAEDRIRYKNMLRDAEALLGDDASFLEPARALLDDEEFWTNLSDSVAMFCATSFFKVAKAPFPLATDLVVGRRFYVKPLLGLASLPGRFYVLALSQDVQLFECTLEGIKEVAISGAVQSLKEFNKREGRWDDLQQHSLSNRGAGAIFHGQGAGKDMLDERQVKFFQQIENAVSKHLNTSRARLLLAGTQESVALYARINQYPHLEPEPLLGSTKRTPPNDIHRQAWKYLLQKLETQKTEAVERFKQLRGSERAVDHPEAVLKQAAQRRIKTLLVALDRHLWGYWDEETLSAQTLQQWQTDAEDLLDRAAVLAASNGATVYTLPEKRMPSALAAASLY